MSTTESRPVSLASAVRSLLEVGVLVALGYWGYVTGGSVTWRVALGVGAPLAAAIVWGLLVAPKAQRRLDDPARLGVELVVFGAATAALVLAGQTHYAVAFAVAVVVDEAVLAYVGER